MDTSNDKQALLHQLKVSATWVHVMIASQLILSASIWYQTYFVFLIVHTLFVLFGLAGVSRRSKILIFTHFVYSSTLSFLLIFSMCYAIMTGYPTDFYVIAFAVAFLLIQSVGMRHERALLALIPLAQELENVEAGYVPLSSVESAEEQQPFILSYESQQQLTEAEQMQLFAQMDASASEKKAVPSPATPQQTAVYEPVSTMPQYPAMLPSFPGQHPFLYVPFHVNPNGMAQAASSFYPAPMVHPQMMPYPPVMIPPATSYNNKF